MAVAALTRVRVSFAALLALSLSGCPKPDELILVNNASSTCSLILMSGERVALPPSGVVRLPGAKHPYQLVRRDDSDNLVRALEIEGPTGTLEYVLGEVFPLPQDFVPDSSPTRIYLQLEDDFLLYAVKPTQVLPVQNLPNQPWGFPVSPTLRPSS